MRQRPASRRLTVASAATAAQVTIVAPLPTESRPEANAGPAATVVQVAIAARKELEPDDERSDITVSLTTI
jgi:hypothetical protein